MKILILLIIATGFLTAGCGELDCTEVIKKEWREYPHHYYGKEYKKVIKESTCRRIEKH